MRTQIGRKGHAFFRRVVDDEHAVHACRCGIAHKGAGTRRCAVFLVIALHRVGVTHQHNRRAGIAGAKGPHHLQHLCHADPEGQRPVARALDDRAVRARVGEGDAELNDVGPAAHHGVHQIGRDIGKRKARRDVGNERGAPLGF